MSAQLAAPLHGPVTLSLPFAAESAGEVRRALVSWLRHNGSDDERIEDVRLVATELVGNALTHAEPLANGSVLVRWQRNGGQLHLTVCDGGGETEPQARVAAAQDEHGRGLRIVEQLGARWWTERSRRVHAVHVEMPLV
ncbi:MAG: histidine kinase, gyrase and HSP90-like ATPase family protein [Marmoricola sp.]|nr:histidine kinase, gyrase and HSP90-like ATPase family protein [Marmoricola sp.]